MLKCRQNPNPHRKPITNPNPIANLKHNLTISGDKPNANPDPHANNYLAIVCNHYSTKTAHLQAPHKYNKI